VRYFRVQLATVSLCGKIMRELLFTSCKFLRFEILTALLLKIQVFWDGMLYLLVNIY
jgi:hypothetical protein